MKEVVLQRVKDFIEKKGVSKNAFAKSLGMEQTTVNNQLIGKRGMSIDLILSFLHNYPDISAEWLLRGNGEMFLKEENKEPAAPSQQSESEDVQFMRERIISLESENRVLREMLGLQRDSKQHVDEKIAL